MGKIDHEPDLMDGKFLGQISEDFVKVSDVLKEASFQVRAKNFSKFPIFPMAKEEIKIGRKLFDVHELDNEWKYYVSTLEEFLQICIITDEAAFSGTYKDPDEFCCLFVVSEGFVNFVFIPFPVD